MLGVKYLSIIQKKHSSYNLASHYTNLGPGMQMALEVLLLVNVQCSQKLNLQ